MKGENKMLRIDNLTKYYGENKALNQFSIVLTPGIYGLLGPNGSGKSTLMNLICMLIEPSEGQIFYNEVNIQNQKKTFLKQLGYMPQYHCLYDDFKVIEYLYYVGCLKGMDKTTIRKESEVLLKEVDLDMVKNQKISTLSGGMKQRLMLAQALLNNPKILILDEPTAGLDPQKRIEIRNLITRYSKDKIILIATHVVSDVELIAKEILILKKGVLIKNDSPLNLMEELNGYLYEIETEKSTDIKNKHQICSLYYKEGKIFTKFIKRDDELLNDAVSIYPDLEDVYLYYFDDESNHI